MVEMVVMVFLPLLSYLSSPKSDTPRRPQRAGEDPASLVATRQYHRQDNVRIGLVGKSIVGIR